MEYVFNKTPRKADYVTFFAIVLFVFVVVFELLLVSWLPSKMMNAKGIESETAKQEITDLVDTLRKHIRNHEKRVKTGEVDLVAKCLDNIARYLRLNSKTMTRDQVRDVMEDLTKFEMIMRGWNKGKSYSKTIEFETTTYLEKIIKNDTNDKNN